MVMRVLVTDDSRLSRRSVIRALPPELEYDIYEAANGKEAIALLNERPFELMLLDLTMPEIDGIGVLKYLANQSQKPHTVVISADFQPEKQRLVLELGAMKFLQKPLDAEDLAMALFELGYL